MFDENVAGDSAARDLRRIHAVFEGECQGVGFRWTSQEIANRLHLTGWVKNLSDGTVEMELQGSDEGISRFFGQLNNAYKRWHTVFYPAEKDDVPPVSDETEFKVRF